MSKLISGIWYFNEVLTFDNAIADYPINFTSIYQPNEKFTVMDAYSEDPNGILEYETATYDEYVVYGSRPEWSHEEARTVNFGSTPQSVSDEFYTWLTANATKSGLSNLKTVTESIKKYVDSKDADIKESVNSKAAAGAQSIDTSIAQIKDVPSDTAKYAGINKIGGMTRKCTNLWDEEWYNASLNENTGVFTEAPTADVSSKNFISVLPNTEYYKSVTAWVAFYDNSKAFISASSYSAGVLTTPNDCYFMKFQTLVGNYGTVYKNDIIISEGSTALPYEPYFEGLRDAKVTEMKSVGANLWDEQYRLNSGGTYLITLNHIPVKPNTRYFINVRPSNGLYAFDKDKKSIGVITYVTGAFTTPDNTYFVTFHLGTEYGAVYKNDVMLNEGSTALPYTPYMESTLLVPEAVQAIDGYGWGINANCYNYVDWEKKQFVKRVEKVDLGTLNWRYDAGQKRFYASVPNLASVDTRADNILSSKFSTDLNATVGDDWKGFSYLSSVYVYTTEYTDAATFKAAMAGVMLYYELAEPIITNISDLLPEDNFIEVEGNGSITAVNEYGYDVPSEIVFNIKNNEQVNANTFVGDLIGKAQSAERDGAGRLLEDTYMSYSYDKVYTGETAAVSEFYAGETTYVSGVWVFNESLSFPDKGAITQNINFVCEGVNCNLISVYSNSVRFDPLSTEIAYDVYYDNVWTDEAYRTVDFGEKDQLTSPEFYTWLCANARRVEA